jgi:hypothetical protein
MEVIVTPDKDIFELLEDEEEYRSAAGFHARTETSPPSFNIYIAVVLISVDREESWDVTTAAMLEPSTPGWHPVQPARPPLKEWFFPRS